VKNYSYLFEAAKAAGMYQWWIAQQLGVHKTTVRRWMTGKIIMPNHRQDALRDLLFENGVLK
jgi:hypothetical protein